MADYYPLIARAVAGLDSSATGEQRRALYERARTALVAQLRSVTPALSESDITRERLALESSIRKVEAEAAQRARAEAPPALTESTQRARAGDALRGRGSASSASTLERPSRPDRPALSARPDAPRTERRTEPRIDDGMRPEPPDLTGGRDRMATSSRRARPERPSLSEQGNRGFRDVVADADALGPAAAQASRSARDTYNAVPSPSPEFDRLEPDMEQRSADNLAYSFDESIEEAERHQAASSRVRTPVQTVKSESSVGRIIKFVVFALLLAGLVGVGWWQGPRAVSAVTSVIAKLTGPSKSTTTVEAPAEPNGQATNRPKINDRVGQPGQTVAPVAQRVVLYDEDPAEPTGGKQLSGTVVWRTEQVPASAGQPADVGVRADIEIPDRKMKIVLTFRRNTDASLPASHTAEVNFVLPPDFGNGGIANVPGMMMKPNEQTRGAPLAGLAVKVTDNFFLLGLSNVETDRQRNIQLLKDRAWLDIPLVYANQRKGLIAVEKGSPGERAFGEVFAAWGQ